MDFISNKRNERYKFFKNLNENAVAEAAKMGANPADALTLKTLAGGIVARMDATDKAETDLASARLLEKTNDTASMPQVRAIIRNWKTLPGYPTSGSEAILKLKGEESGFDPATYKPVFKAVAKTGKVQLTFKKGGVDGMAFYMRLRGQTTFRRLGGERKSPFYDLTPLAAAGVAEVREYYARGMMGDDEIGLDSDIVTVTFGG